MQLDLVDLRITPDQLEKLTGLDISETFMGRVYRPSVFRSVRRFLPFLITEGLTFALILIFCLPLGLVIGRGLGWLSNAGTTLIFFLFLLGFSVLLFAIWNLYMWQQGKRLKTLAHLLDEVDKHNDIIEAVDVMDQLSAVQSASIQLIDRSEVLQALAATRESLVNALMTEKIFRKYRQFMNRRQELFTNIESNLATLQTLQIDAQANEYGQLLNQALQIGLSLRQEIRQWQQLEEREK
ncbi:MAG: hypothetical protein MUF72_12565 [Elainella sp. Prado103]|jgi:hypothetical protein|nr:hypothetical protein [Elainella sp. Prado103]